MTNAHQLLLDLMREQKSGSCTVGNCYSEWYIESRFAYTHRKGYDVNELRCVFNLFTDGEPKISTDWHPDTHEGREAFVVDIIDILENGSK